MYIVFLPDGNTKECHTQRSATREVRKWNAKNPGQNTCSLWAVRQVMPKVPAKESILKKLINYLTGRV